MRVGQNPVKAVESIAPPAPVTVVLITYIPFLSGYYAQALDVLKLCLESLWAHTVGDYDLMVFDNASCAEVRDYLLAAREDGRIQYLTLAERNLGKAGAWNLALAAAPGDLIAYADADVYFHPGWLEAGQAALKAFPQAGMVTLMPLLTPQQYSTASIAWAEGAKGIKLQRGQVLPWEDFWRHARSLGDNEEGAREFYEANEALRLERDGKAYFVGAGHFQFIAPKSVLDEVLPIPAERPMGRVRLLDEIVNQRGYLRLCTADRYVEHMGNTLPEASAAAASGARRSRRSLPGPLRRVLQWLHDKSFEILFRQ